MNEIKDLLVGITSLYYNEDGTLSSGFFTPFGFDLNGDQILERMKFIDAGQSGDELANHAKVVLAGFFSRANEIELADREKYEILPTVIECQKWPSGTVKKCVIRFTLKSKNHDPVS